MELVCAIALPIVAIVFIRWLVILVDDPSYDGPTLLLAVLFMLGILWIATPLIEMGVGFYAAALELATGG